MSILEAIIRAASTYETETGSKLKGIELSLRDFKCLLEELNYSCVAAECHIGDPYCGLMIDGMNIGWNEEIKKPSEWGSLPSEEDEQRKLKAGIEEDHEEERAARDWMSDRPYDEKDYQNDLKKVNEVLVSTPNDDHENNREAAKKLVEGFASSMDNIFKDALGSARMAIKTLGTGEFSKFKGKRD